VCLLHGVDDELLPFSQSVQRAREQERRGPPHEFHSYEGLKHYFSTSADNATGNWQAVAWQMLQDSLDCLRGFLEGEE
jgi:dipeptidyl aminopeptidase/acylaminoacyl peptidase